MTGASFSGADLAGSVWEDALIGSQDVAKLCDNPTLTGDSRLQVGGQGYGYGIGEGKSKGKGKGKRTAVDLVQAVLGGGRLLGDSRLRLDRQGKAGRPVAAAGHGYGTGRGTGTGTGSETAGVVMVLVAMQVGGQGGGLSAGLARRMLMQTQIGKVAESESR